jgi:hypothetical protein
MQKRTSKHTSFYKFWLQASQLGIFHRANGLKMGDLTLFGMLFIRVNWNRAIITLLFLKYAITIRLTMSVPL